MSSELVAYYCSPCLINNVNGGKYVLTKEWEKLEYDDIEEQIKEQKKIERIDYRGGGNDYIIDERIIQSESKYSYVHTFKLKSSYGAKNFYLRINNINFDDNFVLDYFKDWVVFLRINGVAKFSINLNINILIAKLKGRKIECFEDCIKIPLLFIDIFGDRKLPLDFFYDAEIRIAARGVSRGLSLCGKDTEILFSEFRPSLGVDKKIGRKPSFFVMQCYQRFINFDTGGLGTEKIAGIVKLIFIRFTPKNSEKIVKPYLKEIHLSLNWLEPMIFKDDDFIRLELLEETYYCISFFPNIKSKSALKKMFRQRMSNIDAKVHFTGITLGRIESVKFSYIMDQDISEYNIEYYTIESNVLCIWNGGAGIQYHRD